MHTLLLSLFVVLALNSTNLHPNNWGFYPHKLINRHAIFTLPPSMITFYKHHMHFLSEEAVKADHRRYAVPDEAARHYIDLDYYGIEVRRNWQELILEYPKDSLDEHGVLPWHLLTVRFQLIKAFKEADLSRILRLSADAGHYLADAHVPLHTTVNYNGQLTGQHGIHGFWETRLPELLHPHFDLWIGPATYQTHWNKVVWEIVLASHSAVDSVLFFEKNLSIQYPEDKKFSYEVRLSRLVKVYSKEFSKSYHQALNGQVEKRLRASIRVIGNFWYSCWVDAGQPDLESLLDRDKTNIVEYQRVADSLWRKQHALRK